MLFRGKFEGNFFRTTSFGMYAYVYNYSVHAVVKMFLILQEQGTGYQIIPFQRLLLTVM